MKLFQKLVIIRVDLAEQPLQESRLCTGALEQFLRLAQDLFVARAGGRLQKNPATVGRS